MKDYKKLIEELRDFSYITISQKAADAIEQLVKERDTAIADLKIFLDCDVCKNNNDECLNNGLCKECSVGKSTRKHWEWRGIQE